MESKTEKSRDSKKKTKGAFCNYPFTQLLLQPTGVVSPCCWNQEIVLGKIPENSLMEIWNGEKIQSLREEFLKGMPVSCATQISHIGCHEWSQREEPWELDRDVIQKKGPQRFDLRLNGRCNLECVMCDVWEQPNGLYNESDFWKEGPKTIFPHLREIDVLGGEPFIQQDTYRLIDEVQSSTDKCTWAFVTNAHYRFSDRIRSYLDRIDIRWMQVSLDSVNPETYAKVRKKGNLRLVLDTLDALLNYKSSREMEGRGFRFVASMCVQKENWKEVGSFLNFCQEKRMSPILQFAYQPESESLLSASEDNILETVNFFKKLTRIYGEHTISPVLLPIKEILESKVSSSIG